MGGRCSWAVGVGDVVGGPAYPVARADLMGTVTRVISQATTACFHPTLSCPSRQEEGIDFPLPSYLSRLPRRASFSLPSRLLSLTTPTPLPRPSLVLAARAHGLIIAGRGASLVLSGHD